VVDPSGSGDGFDDVQDLHEKRVVMRGLCMNAVKTIPKRAFGAECKCVSWAELKLTD
jgi:hypothetical protein